MKRLFIALFATLVGLGLFVQDAEAKRLGGSRSFGMSRDSSVMKREALPAKPATPTQNAAAAPGAKPTPAPAAQPSGMRRWLGPLAGLAAGIGLAALFSHLGLGEGMANFVMLALLAMAAIFVIRLLFRRSAPQAAPQYAGAGNAEPVRFEPITVAGGTAATPAAEAAHIPADFDVEGFLRQAKLNFIRLQAANDAGNMEDIKTFATPEVYAEVEMQYRERGGAKQQTDVVQLDAGLLDVASEDKRHVASVRFHGLIREAADAAPETFDEVWHLVKPTDGSEGWRVAGIQQML